jgi:hypothetical protein
MSNAVGVARFIILFGKSKEARPKLQLLPHLSEARTAIFAVKYVKYVGHDRTPCSAIAVNILMEHLRGSRR